MAGVTSHVAGPALARALGRVLDAWLPRTCALCDLPLPPREPGVCAGCLAELPGRLAARCHRCGARFARAPRAAAGVRGAVAENPGLVAEVSGLVAEVPGALAEAPRAAADVAGATSGEQTCDRCLSAPPAFDRTVVLADYAAPIDRLIVALKFHGELALARPLGALLAARLRAEPVFGTEIVTWVPLAPQRLTSRGFDQARALARAAARHLPGVRATALLRRARETQPQSTLPLRQRVDNLAGAMRATGGAGRRVVVVDDVMTSGATLQAAAQALKQAGARTVVNLVAARTP